MMVYGLNAAEVEAIVCTVSHQGYDDNVILRNCVDVSGPRRGPAARFTLKVVDSYGAGARGSAMMSGRGPNGTRALPVACWHAHFHVLQAMRDYVHATGRDFKVRGYYNYEAPVNGSGLTLEDQMNETRYHNYGSAMQPSYPTELCECEL